MKYDVLLPQVELNMESVAVVRWLAAVGDYVKAEQPILEVETQKAVTEVPSPRDGYLRVTHVKAGDEIKEKSLLATLTDAAEEALAPQAAVNEAAPELVRAESCSLSSAVEASRTLKQYERYPVRATPLARKIARELGVDIRRVTGRGPAGRVRHADVKAFKETQVRAPVAVPMSSARTAFAETSVVEKVSAASSGAWTPIDPARLALIEQMQRAITRIPQINLVRQMDVTQLSIKKEGVTFTHRLIVALARALTRHPSLRTVTDGTRIMTMPVSVAVAMDTPHGLLAPVIRAADSLSLMQVVATLNGLRQKAKDGLLRRSDFVDGPFALTNLGMYSVDQFDPLIFDGQTAVLAVGRATEAAAGRRVAWFTLAADHRVVDGAEAARFMQSMQEEVLLL